MAATEEVKTLDDRTDEAIAILELDFLDQAKRYQIIDVLKEWRSREETLRNES